LRRRRRGSPELVEQGDDILVLDLCEDVVPEPDGPEVLLLVRTHDLVRLLAEKADAQGLARRPVRDG